MGNCWVQTVYHRVWILMQYTCILFAWLYAPRRGAMIETRIVTWLLREFDIAPDGLGQTKNWRSQRNYLG
jgi:hypothetical protein